MSWKSIMKPPEGLRYYPLSITLWASPPQAYQQPSFCSTWTTIAILRMKTSIWVYMRYLCTHLFSIKCSMCIYKTIMMLNLPKGNDKSQSLFWYPIIVLSFRYTQWNKLLHWHVQIYNQPLVSLIKIFAQHCQCITFGDLDLRLNVESFSLSQVQHSI